MESHRRTAREWKELAKKGEHRWTADASRRRSKDEQNAAGPEVKKTRNRNDDDFKDLFSSDLLESWEY